MNSYFLLWNHHSTEVQQLRVRAVVLVDHHTFVPAVVVAGVRRAILPDCRRLQRAGAERSFCWRAAAQQLTDRERRSRATSCNTAQLAQFVRLPLLPPPHNSHRRRRRRRCRSLVCSTALAWATTTIPTVANSPLPWRLPRRHEDIPDFNRPRPLAMSMWPLRMNPRSRQVLVMTIGLMMC